MVDSCGTNTYVRNITLWLERENRELRRSDYILRQASAYFAKAEFDRLWKKYFHFWISCLDRTGP
ncbi:hypothetical protein UQ00_27360, partial [Escherichia coli]